MAVRALLGKKKPGVVVVISSMAGLKAAYVCPLYCATKFAMIGFVKAMATADEDQGVKVVCICPGSVLPFSSHPHYLIFFALVVFFAALLHAKRLVETGIFDTFPHKMDYGSMGPGIRPSAIAEAMLELVQEKQYPGGSIMAFPRPDLKYIVDPESNVKIGEKGSVQEILEKERGT